MNKAHQLRHSAHGSKQAMMLDTVCLSYTECNFIFLCPHGSLAFSALHLLHCVCLLLSFFLEAWMLWCIDVKNHRSALLLYSICVLVAVITDSWGLFQLLQIEQGRHWSVDRTCLLWSTHPPKTQSLLYVFVYFVYLFVCLSHQGIIILKDHESKGFLQNLACCSQCQ